MDCVDCVACGRLDIAAFCAKCLREGKQEDGHAGHEIIEEMEELIPIAQRMKDCVHHGRQAQDLKVKLRSLRAAVERALEQAGAPAEDLSDEIHDQALERLQLCFSNSELEGRTDF